MGIIGVIHDIISCMDVKRPPLLEYEPEGWPDENGKWLDYVIEIAVNITLVLVVLGLVMYFLLSRGGSPGS